MRIAVQNLNRGIALSKSRLEAEYQKYVIMYGQACHRLFSLGYLTTPSWFDRMDFVYMLSKDYPKYLDYFKTYSGSMDFTYRRVSYILSMCRMDEDERELFTLFHDVLKAEEGIRVLTSIYNVVKFRKTMDTVIVKPRLVLTSSLKNNGTVPLENPLAWGIMDIPVEYGVYKLDLSPIFVETIAEDMGYTEKEIWLSKQQDTSILFDGRSFSDDCKWVDLLMAGKIVGGKRFSKRYSEYYEQFYLENMGNKLSCVAYNEYIFIKCMHKLFAVVDDWRRQVSAVGGSEFFLTDTFILFKSPTPLSGLERLDAVVPMTETYLGICALDYLDRLELSKQNTLRGITGEFVSVEGVKVNGWVVDGLPLTLVGKNGSCGRYYPLFCVRRPDSCSCIPPLLGRSIDFEYTDAIELCRRMGIRDMEDFSRYVEVNLLKSVDLELRGIVAKLVQGMVCIECDYTLRGNSSPNHVRFDCTVDDAKFQSSVMIAAMVFKQLNL